MSLRVWLPLNGKIVNQGLSPASITFSDNLAYTTGKLGQAVVFDNSAKYISTDIIDSAEISMSAWIYMSSTPTSKAVIISQSSGTDGVSIYVDSTRKCSFQYGNTVISSNALNANTWYHITAVLGIARGAELYVNGSMVASNSNYTAPTYTNVNGLVIGRLTPTTTSNPFTGRICDVRVYNNALSAKKVKLLSMGLVAHYPLNHPGLHHANLVNTNASTGFKLNTGTMATSINGVCIDYSKTSTTPSFYIPLMNDISAGAYVLSFDVEGVSNTDDIVLSIQNGASITVQNGRNVIELNLTTTVSSSVGLLATATGPSTSIVLMTRFKLEPGVEATNYLPSYNDPVYSKLGFDSTNVTDTAGYGNHTQFVGGIPTPIGDSARYSGSYQFSSGISLPIPALELSECTVCYWSKSGNTWTFNKSNAIPSSLGGSNIALSDIRVYATKLSDEDLSDLETVAISVDNGNYIHAYSFNESDSFSIDSKGVLSNIEFIEVNDIVKIYGSQVTSREFYEI